jgi:hypothetical protein
VGAVEKQAIEELQRDTLLDGNAGEVHPLVPGIKELGITSEAFELTIVQRDL